MRKPLFEVKDLVKLYGGKRVVDGLCFSLFPGEVVGLLGPNGAGKTTAFYMAVGLIHPDGGEVCFKGKSITSLPMHQRAQMGLGYLAQEPSVFRDLSVEDNLLCILETLPLTHKQRSERLKELLHELYLDPLRKKRASALSGGERRRLEITRALITQPSLLLLDEPFANIDPKAISDLKHLIRHLQQKQISVLITDHNAREIGKIVDRSYLMREGKVLAEGTMAELLSHPEARQSYFGEDF
ncbi:MAG: LPS export ABC transporter ATP-binding protein [Chlamydiia bacterium]|nr:LPS export ABC transporter ATP-binding protein [Chlamydiia bacterium]